MSKRVSAARLAEIKARMADDGPTKTKVDAAFQMVFDLCRGGFRYWRMSIPVQEDRDSDTVIVAGLREVESLRGDVRDIITDLEAEREQRRVLREELKRLEWGPVVYVGGWPNPYCPSCQKMRDSGHSKDCSLAKLLAATEGGP